MIAYIVDRANTMQLKYIHTYPYCILTTSLFWNPTCSPYITYPTEIRTKRSLCLIDNDLQSACLNGSRNRLDAFFV